VSYVALATDAFDQVAMFYGEGLRFPVVAEWDRASGRGRRFDLGSFRLEILDNARERHPLPLGRPADRFHIVIEVDDLDAVRGRLAIESPSPQSVSWGARLFQVRDPDGVPVTFLQWDPARSELS
jgi:catechol 2,3-dioxygenase-like lactoylglutathione lyase family enzyme